ncbi:MAG: GspH/FimT family pseudopilin [Gammaproteobacteria bacterium]|nr:GspH/FimT family pseudopilin [Gammaproteobacteria bacterium]
MEFKNSALKIEADGMRLGGLKNKQYGFNIVELMTIVLVVGIIAAISAPSYEAFIKNQAIASVSTEVITAFQLARTEAIKRSVPVKVCFRNKISNVDCEDPHLGSSNINGIIIFVDTNADDVLDTGEETIYTSSELNDKVSLIQVANNNVGGSILYNQKGGATFEAGDSQTSAYIAICDDRALNRFGRLITLSATGRATLSTLPDGYVVTCT